MSADNYYVIRNHPEGGYAAVMGFASDNFETVVDPKRHLSYASFKDAVAFASGQEAEYGVHVHPETVS